MIAAAIGYLAGVVTVLLLMRIAAAPSEELPPLRAGDIRDPRHRP